MKSVTIDNFVDEINGVELIKHNDISVSYINENVSNSKIINDIDVLQYIEKFLQNNTNKLNDIPNFESVYRVQYELNDKSLRILQMLRKYYDYFVYPIKVDIDHNKDDLYDFTYIINPSIYEELKLTDDNFNIIDLYILVIQLIIVNVIKDFTFTSNVYIIELDNIVERSFHDIRNGHDKYINLSYKYSIVCNIPSEFEYKLDDVEYEDSSLEFRQLEYGFNRLYNFIENFVNFKTSFDSLDNMQNEIELIENIFNNYDISYKIKYDDDDDYSLKSYNYTVPENKSDEENIIILKNILWDLIDRVNQIK